MYQIVIGRWQAHEPLSVDGVVEEPVGRWRHRNAAFENIFWREIIETNGENLKIGFYQKRS
jgi:hypothetical protein